MSVENLNEEFRRWNPMENDYKSKEFNQYNTGPGANLDAALQPCQQATNRDSITPVENDGPTPYLLFKNMPQKMTKSALYNICLRHGKVTSVRDSQKCDYFFADFATVADMESTFRALENNNYGFTVYVGRNIKKPSLPIDHHTRDNKVINVPPRTTGIDYHNRTYRVSGKQQPRPSFNQSPVISGEHYKGLSPDVVNNDAHFLEREGLHVPQQNDKFKYQTGRSYVVMPQSTRDFVNKKHEESSGRYSPSREMFINKMDGALAPGNFDKCVYCSRECDNICSRCSAYYCSVECQKSDWQQHRAICGKPKNLLKKMPKKNEEKSTLSPKEAVSCKTDALQKTKSAGGDMMSESNDDQSPQLPRSGNIVTITSISKPNVVFIRSKTYEANMSYFTTVDGLQSVGKKLKPLTSPPKCGNVVVAKFDNQYNRALVLNSSNPEKIFVNYMDYGNLDGKNIGDLYEAPEEYAHRPRHAIPVMLKGVPDCYMTEEIRNFMYPYLNGINVYIKYKPEDYNRDKHVYKVELIDETTSQNLNKMILKLSKPTEPTNICCKDYLEQKLLPTGNNIELIVMDNSLMTAGCISCTTKPFAIEIQKFQKELQKYVESLPKECYAPRADELCVARHNEDGLWYRGRCLEVVGDGHPTILFIDYGNISMIHINDIRRYPSQFTYPIYTVDCEIQGLPESCADALVEKLEELIPHGSIIKCDNIVMASEEDHFYSISLPGVIQKLSEYIKK